MSISRSWFEPTLSKVWTQAPSSQVTNSVWRYRCGSLTEGNMSALVGAGWAVSAAASDGTRQSRPSKPPARAHTSEAPPEAVSVRCGSSSSRGGPLVRLRGRVPPQCSAADLVVRAAGKARLFSTRWRNALFTENAIAKRHWWGIAAAQAACRHFCQCPFHAGKPDAQTRARDARERRRAKRAPPLLARMLV